MTNNVNTIQICFRCILNNENMPKWKVFTYNNFKIAAESQGITHNPLVVFLLSL